MRGGVARRRRSALAGAVVVLALGLGLWVAAGGRRAGDAASPAPAAAAETGASERAALADAGGAERVAVGEPGRAAAHEGAVEAAGEAVGSTALVVRSTLGLALSRAFFVDQDGVERPIALDAAGACSVPRAPPFLVRASGHREREVVAPGEVALEPVLGVVLRAPELVQRTVEARLFWYPVETYPEHEDWAVAGFAREDVFAIALDPRGRSVGGMPFGFVPIDLATAELQRIDIEIQRHAEGTYEHELALGEPAGGTLALHAGPCPTGCGAPIERVLWTWSLDGARSTTATEQPWGVLRVSEGWGPLRAAEAEERVVAGEEYGVGARCSRCGAYSRRFVVAAAGPSTVELPLEHRGTVLVARVDRARFDRVRLSWQGAWDVGRPLGDREGWGWFGEALLEPDEDGAVRLVLPRAVPVSKECAWPMPPAARVTAAAFGTEPAEVWTELPPGGTVDLGRLDLEGRAPDLLLAAGHGAKSPRYVGLLDSEWFPGITVERSQPRPDGALELYLYPRAPFDPADPPEHVLLCDDEDRILALERAEGRHVVAPSTRRTLRIECGPSGLAGAPAEVWAGVRWAGIELRFNVGLPAPSPGGPVEWTLEWPADAESLWWTIARDDPRRYVPLHRELERVELR